MIVKDDTPFYPLEEEEARQLLFDFNRDIEIKPEALKKGKNNIAVFVELSWGKHEFIELLGGRLPASFATLRTDAVEIRGRVPRQLTAVPIRVQ